MKKRWIVIVLDGFGIGAMQDARIARPGDEVSNTLGSILQSFPNMKLPNLEKLGLMNAFGQESKQMKYSNTAIFGQSELQHFGADTFMGHQEIMGTSPKKPEVQPFQGNVDVVSQHLQSLHHKVEIKTNGNLRYLLVDDVCTVADNIDADPGMAYNCTAPLDQMCFDKLLEIGRHVREVVTVNRVIPFGGTHTTIDDILAAEMVKNDIFIGIHAVKSKSYEHGYQCLHLGYGVDEKVQVPYLLAQEHIPVSLFGKVADIVANEQGKSVSCVDTAEVLDLTIQELKDMDFGFICTNVQQSDLAGHSQDATWYKEILEIADEKIGIILQMLKEDDILLIMADHGNDPNIGHNQHTRENVPILLAKQGKQGIHIGLRKTLSDVGASICDYFEVKSPQNGTSFLFEL